MVLKLYKISGVRILPCYRFLSYVLVLRAAYELQNSTYNDQSIIIVLARLAHKDIW